MEIGSDEAEITMYGEIVDTRPYDLWSGEYEDGDFIIKNEVLDSLDKIVKSGVKKVKIKMDSVGGNCDVSILIHNRLREMARENGIEISCIVDGVAMSGGSIIMCACDDVAVNPSSLIMIHKCWSFLFGGYNADELREMAKSNDAYDNAQISVYTRKTGISETVLRHMMSETTYLNAEEAIDKGFADRLLEDAEPFVIAASADRSALYVRGKTLKLGRGAKIPESIPTVEADPVPDRMSIENLPNTEEGGNTMATNLTELREENPTLAAAVEEEIRAAVMAENSTAVENAVAAERNRLQEIDEIAGSVDPEMLREAKYGATPCNAQELAFNAMKMGAKSASNASFLKNLGKDYQTSGVSNICPAPQEPDTPRVLSDSERLENAKAEFQSLLGKETKKKEEQ